MCMKDSHKTSRGAAKPPTRGFWPFWFNVYSSLLVAVGGSYSSLFRRCLGTPGGRAVGPSLRQHLRVQRPRMPPLASAVLPRPSGRGVPLGSLWLASPLPLPPPVLP